MPMQLCPQTTAESHKRRSGLQGLSPPKRPCFSPFTEGRQRPAAASAGEAGAAAAAQGGAAAWWERCRSAWRTVRAAAGGVLGGLEAGLRSTLRANLHALVALLLILGLFVGTTGLAAFLSVRVAPEGRATVLAVRDVFPAAWAGMAASTPLLADAVAAAGGGSGAWACFATHGGPIAFGPPRCKTSHPSDPIRQASAAKQGAWAPQATKESVTHLALRQLAHRRSGTREQHDAPGGGSQSD